MTKLEKIIKVLDEVGIDYERLSDKEITIPCICDINNNKKTKKDSYNYTYEEWLKEYKKTNSESMVLCSDCQTFAIKLYDHENFINVIGMIDKDILDNNEED